MIHAEHPLAALPLRALALVYGLAVRARNRRYDRRGPQRRVRVPVVSIGNLTVGGTGKTPLVAWLARRLHDEGLRPAIVSRGYGGSAGRGPCVVSRGDGLLCGVARCGDEPFLLASLLPGVPVVVGSDRAAAAGAAVELGAAMLLLDDGFQHRRLARDLDIVLLDAAEPFGNGRLLPAGPLREPPAALERADLVLLTGCRPGDPTLGAEREVLSHHPGATIARAGRRRLGFRDAAGRPARPPRRAVVFCGIAAPQRLRDDVEAEGVEIAAFEPHRDHHVFRPAELRRLRARAAALGAALVTTEKDRVRLPADAPAPGATPLLTLAVEADPHDPAALLGPIRALRRRGAA